MSLKTFNIASIIDNLQLASLKPNIQITCLEVCGKNLYLGTEDCFLLHYLVEEKRGPDDDKIDFKCSSQGYKYLLTRKPIDQLSASTAINRILYLCDSSLSMLNMFNMEIVTATFKVKNVIAFALNNNPVRASPFNLEICASTKKKSVQILLVKEDSMVLLKEIQVNELAVELKMDGIMICMALSSGEYKMVDSETSDIQDLFPFDKNTVHPIITHIEKDEFLLNASNTLGVFAAGGGISQRPPLQWINDVIAVAYVYPYLLVLNDEFVTVHSILDQQQKQTILFTNGRYLGYHEGHVYLATEKEVYALVFVAIEKQIQALILDKRVTEALELAKHTRGYQSKSNTENSKEDFNRMLSRIELQAGFVEFVGMNFQEAKNYFLESKLDVKELISLYPHFWISNKEFIKSTTPLHEISSVSSLTGGEEKFNSAKAVAYDKFLFEYLMDFKKKNGSIMSKEDLLYTNTALLKYHVTKDIQSTLSFINSFKLSISELDNIRLKLKNEDPSGETKNQDIVVILEPCDLNDCADYFKSKSRFHIAAILLTYQFDKCHALNIWKSLSLGELSDSDFPGINHVIHFLSDLGDTDLIWKNVYWLLEKDETAAVQVFIKNKKKSETKKIMQRDLGRDLLTKNSTENKNEISCFDIEKVYQHLKKFSQASLIYLEFLVLQLDLPQEKYHTELVLKRLDIVLKLLKTEPIDAKAIEAARSKLRDILKSSNLYRVHMIMTKMNEAKLSMECAILHGKLGEHEKALSILVSDLKIFTEAESYCIEHSVDQKQDQSTISSSQSTSQKLNIKSRKDLYRILLSIYLQLIKERAADEFINPIISLLNKHHQHFDLTEIVKLLPENWSLGLLGTFLVSSFRRILNASRTGAVEKSLALAENNLLKAKIFETNSKIGPFFVTEDRICHVCQGNFIEPGFVALFPQTNKSIAHLECLNLSS